MSVTLADVQAAAQRIHGAVARTPSAVSETLSEILGCTVVLKFETFQFTGSFKERGARNRLAALTPEERTAGVVAVSAGNHGQAVARHAALLGIPSTIVMPTWTPFVKVSRTRALGAQVEIAGDGLDQAMLRGRELEAAGRVLIHPYDDPLIVAGQGTAALELLADHPDLEAIVVPVGGGGLIAGVSVVAAANSPSVEVIGVQSAAFDAVAKALGSPAAPAPAGTSQRPPATMAEGIAVAEPGVLPLEILRAHGREVLTVNEQAIEEGVDLVLEIEKVVVEGAGAAGIAGIASHRERFAGRRVGVILTGANIDPRQLAAILDRALVRSGRLARLRVQIEDRPGALAALLGVVADAGANLLEVHHQRLFADLPLRSAEVELVVECMDVTHRDTVTEAIGSCGYRCVLMPLDAV